MDYIQITSFLQKKILYIPENVGIVLQFGKLSGSLINGRISMGFQESYIRFPEFNCNLKHLSNH